MTYDLKSSAAAKTTLIWHLLIHFLLIEGQNKGLAHFLTFNLWKFYYFLTKYNYNKYNLKKGKVRYSN